MLLAAPFQAPADIATIFAALGAVIGAFLVFWTLSVARLSYNLQIADRILQMLERNRENRRWLEGLAPSSDLASFTALGEPVQKRLDQLARGYDQVGLLAIHHLVPLDLLFDFYSRPIVVAWNRLAPHVHDVRRRRPQKGHMEKFEFLAVAAKIYRDATHPGEETFVLTECQLTRWRKAWPKDLVNKVLGYAAVVIDPASLGYADFWSLMRWSDGGTAAAESHLGGAPSGPAASGGPAAV